MKLTKRIVENARPADKDVWLWDSEVPGFGVRVQAAGRKTYVTRYRTQAGTQRKTTIGRCCDMPPEKARELARKVFSAVAEGRDPAAEKHKLRTAPTLKQLSERYMKDHAYPFKKPRSAANDERLWRIHVLPELGARRVDSFVRADMLALQAKLKDAPATANACLALLSKAFTLAEQWEYRTGNPCAKIPKYKLAERETILSPAQIGELDDTLRAMVAADEIPAAMANLVRLLLLTGCRLNEIMSARQSWIDRERKLLLLPDSKVGQRRISLSDEALAIIATIPAGEWLIPGRSNGEHMTSPHSMFKRIKTRAKAPAELRPHDLRHTAGSLAHRAGMSQRQVASMLGHKQMSTTERYLHGVAGDSAAAAETIGKVIAVNFGREPVQAAA
jgi:integrase